MSNMLKSRFIPEADRVVVQEFVDGICILKAGRIVSNVLDYLEAHKIANHYNVVSTHEAGVEMLAAVAPAK